MSFSHKSSESQAAALLQQARHARNQGMWRQARELYEQAFENDPDLLPEIATPIETVDFASQLEHLTSITHHTSDAMSAHRKTLAIQPDRKIDALPKRQVLLRVRNLAEAAPDNTVGLSLFLEGDLLAPCEIHNFFVTINGLSVRRVELRPQPINSNRQERAYTWSFETALPIMLGAEIHCDLRVELATQAWESFRFQFNRVLTNTSRPVESIIRAIPKADSMDRGFTSQASHLQNKACRETALARTPPARICVLKLDHIGDFVICLPALQQLRAAFPDAELTLICSPWLVAFAMATGLFQRVLSFAFFRESSGESARQGLSTGHALRQRHAFDLLLKEANCGQFDLAIDLRQDYDTRPFLVSIQATCYAGFGQTSVFPFLHICFPPAITEHSGHRIPSHTAHDHIAITSSAFKPVVGFRPSQLGLVTTAETGRLPLLILSSDARSPAELGHSGDTRNIAIGIDGEEHLADPTGLLLVSGWYPREDWGIWASSRVALASITAPKRSSQKIVLRSPIVSPHVPRSVSVLTGPNRDHVLIFDRSGQQADIHFTAADLEGAWKHCAISDTIQLVPGDWLAAIRLRRAGPTKPGASLWVLWIHEDGRLGQSVMIPLDGTLGALPDEHYLSITSTPSSSSGMLLLAVEGDLDGQSIEITGVHLDRQTSWLDRQRLHRAEGDMALISSIVAHFGAVPPLGTLVRGNAPIATELLQARRRSGERIVMLAPGCNAEVRKWPLFYWVELGILLQAELPDVYICLIGGPGDVIECATVAEQLNPVRTVNLCAQFNLADLPSAISLGDLFIGNNTGTTHIAAAAGLPVIAIYSGTNHVNEWGPMGRAGTVLSNDQACAPCHIARPEQCPYDLTCLTSISPARVLAAALKELRSPI